MANMDKQDLVARVQRYLERARRDRFNSHNFPVHSERIADDLNLPLDVIIEIGDHLAETRQVERIDKRSGIPPAYRISGPSTEPSKRIG